MRGDDWGRLITAKSDTAPRATAAATTGLEEGSAPERLERQQESATEIGQRKVDAEIACLRQARELSAKDRQVVPTGRCLQVFGLMSLRWVATGGRYKVISRVDNHWVISGVISLPRRLCNTREGKLTDMQAR